MGGKTFESREHFERVNAESCQNAVVLCDGVLDGKTLREWIEANPKPDIKIVVKIIEQLVKGLQAFHRMEMLHQDLNPKTC